MKKSDRISQFLSHLGGDPAVPLHPCYQGYFTCFNQAKYYEAHDVLEHLWLETTGGDHLFFKGLIQIAGAFVHLQKQFLRPDHPKDGRRLHPAVRLFRLGTGNIRPYGPIHLALDIDNLCQLCGRYSDAIEASAFSTNPWDPQHPPQLNLLPS